MKYRIVSFGDKWYVQSQSGRYFGGYLTRSAAENLMYEFEELEAAEE
jgi:hypothetical protein